MRFDTGRCCLDRGFHGGVCAPEIQNKKTHKDTRTAVLKWIRNQDLVSLVVLSTSRLNTQRNNISAR